MQELAFCYDYINEPEKSIRYYEGIIDANPYSYNTWFQLGHVYAGQGLYEKAVNAYEYATLIKDDFVAAHTNMANMYMLQEPYEKAIETYARVVELSEPDSFILITGHFDHLGNIG